MSRLNDRYDSEEDMPPSPFPKKDHRKTKAVDVKEPRKSKSTSSNKVKSADVPSTKSSNTSTKMVKSSTAAVHQLPNKSSDVTAKGPGKSKSTATSKSAGGPKPVAKKSVKAVTPPEAEMESEDISEHDDEHQVTGEPEEDKSRAVHKNTKRKRQLSESEEVDDGSDEQSPEPKPKKHKAKKTKRVDSDDDDVDDDDDDDDDKKKKTKKRRTTKKAKDPNAPKRPASSFMLYMSENRPKTKEAHPEYGPTQIVSAISADWRELSAEDKKPYETAAKAAFETYTIAKEAYESRKQ